MKINLQSRKRRELADHIGEILGTIPCYICSSTAIFSSGNVSLGIEIVRQFVSSLSQPCSFR